MVAVSGYTVIGVSTPEAVILRPHAFGARDIKIRFIGKCSDA